MYKEETPPTNHIEEEGREEVKVNTKLQPTSEQLRLAQITQGRREIYRIHFNNCQLQLPRLWIRIRIDLDSVGKNVRKEQKKFKEIGSYSNFIYKNKSI